MSVWDEMREINSEKAKPAVVSETPKAEPREFDTSLPLDKIAKQEKHMAEMRRKLEDSKKSFEAERSELQRYRDADRYLQSDPISAMERLGISKDKIKDLYQAADDPISAMRRETMRAIEEVRKESRDREESRRREELEASEQRVRAHIANEVRQSDFDIIEHFDAFDSIKEYIDAYKEETGETIDIRQACETIAQEISSKIDKSMNSKYYAKYKTPIQQEESVSPKQAKEYKKEVAAPEKKKDVMKLVKDTSKYSVEQRQDEAFALMEKLGL